MRADAKTASEIESLVAATYEAMSTPGTDMETFFGAADIAIVGSGQGEIWHGPDQAVGAATVVSSWGLRWTAEEIIVWSLGDVAWSQILGAVHVVRDGVDELVPYTTTGVFTRGDDGEWRWAYWGGSEPQEDAKV